jgi:hypothetical protein
VYDGLEWTTEFPTRPGWYWAYEDLDIEDADVFCVAIMHHPFTRKLEIVETFGAKWLRESFSHWLGPLEEPYPQQFIDEQLSSQHK